MMIARWHIDARFGHKETVIKLLKRWNEEIGTKVGWTADKARILTGSIGTPESRITSEIMVEDLAELNASWAKLATVDGHAEWSKELEPYVVSGSNRWEVCRVV